MKQREGSGIGDRRPFDKEPFIQGEGAGTFISGDGNGLVIGADAGHIIRPRI